MQKQTDQQGYVPSSITAAFLEAKHMRQIECGSLGVCIGVDPGMHVELEYELGEDDQLRVSDHNNPEH
jgi:pantoate kinase